MNQIEPTHQICNSMLLEYLNAASSYFIKRSKMSLTLKLSKVFGTIDATFGSNRKQLSSNTSKV